MPFPSLEEHKRDCAMIVSMDMNEQISSTTNQAAAILIKTAS